MCKASIKLSKNVAMTFYESRDLIFMSLAIGRAAETALRVWRQTYAPPRSGGLEKNVEKVDFGAEPKPNALVKNYTWLRAQLIIW